MHGEQQPLSDGESTVPSPADTIPSIPLRTSSIKLSISEPIIPSPSSYFVPTSPSLLEPTSSSKQLPSPPPSPVTNSSRCSAQYSQPLSRCGSMNSSVSYTSSLDHRSMARANHSERVKPMTLMLTGPPNYEKPLPSTPQMRMQTQRSSTSEQRAAFLSSPPVRSHVRVLPRHKNMTPATSTKASVSTPSLTCSISTSTQHQSMAGYHSSRATTQVNLEKRRWSNDSTRGLHGSIASSSKVDLSGTVSRYTSDDDDEYDEYELEDSLGGSSFDDSYEYHNVQTNTTSAKNLGNMKKTKNMKKKYLNIPLFSFMSKK
ncbi:hypothetical protein BGX27_007032 [Mortierella sp. AM989]|nr:hypothetical protein BGX27_007032 [Mortierella sp. AM989]